MADRIQQRRDTKARWEQFNPILLEGEIGYVLDDPNLYKIGDGIHNWNDLKYRGYDGTLVHELGNSQTAAISQAALTMSQGFFSGLIERSIDSIHVKEYYEAIKFIAVVPKEGYEEDDFSIYALSTHSDSRLDEPLVSSLNLWILEDTLAISQNSEVNAAKYIETGDESVLNKVQYLKVEGNYCTLYVIIDWNPIFNYKNSAGKYAPVVWSTNWESPTTIKVQKIKSDDPRIVNWNSLAVKKEDIANEFGVDVSTVMNQKITSSLFGIYNGLSFYYEERAALELKAMRIIKRLYFSSFESNPKDIGIGVLGSSGGDKTVFWFGLGYLDGTSETEYITIPGISVDSLPTGVKSFYVEKASFGKMYVEIDFDAYKELGNLIWSWSTPICKVNNILDKDDELWNNLAANLFIDNKLAEFTDKTIRSPKYVMSILTDSDNNNKIRTAIVDARLILDDENKHDEFWSGSHSFERNEETYISSQRLWGCCQSHSDKTFMNWYWMYPDGNYIPWNSSFSFTKGDGIIIEDGVEYFAKEVVLDGYPATLHIVIDWNNIPDLEPAQTFSGNYFNNSIISIAHDGIIQNILLNKDTIEVSPTQFSDMSKLNFGVDGDSITVGNQWSYYVTQALNLASHHNVGVGSATWACKKQVLGDITYQTQEYDDDDFAGISNGWESTEDPVEIQKRCNNCAKVHIQKFISEVESGIYPEPDIFAFSMGTNDTNYGNAQEALEGKDLPATNSDVMFTMAGAARWAIQKIISTYPNCRVFVLSPIQSSDKERNTNNLSKIEILKEICQGLSVQFIDMYSNCGISEKLENGTGIYLRDGLHPNDKGQKLMGAYASSFIRNNYY